MRRASCSGRRVPRRSARAPPARPVEGAERPGIGVRVRRQGAKRQPSPVPEASRASMRRARSIFPGPACGSTRSRQARSVARSSGCKQNGPSGSRIRSRRVVRRRVLTRSDPISAAKAGGRAGDSAACGGVATKSRISAARASGRSSGSRCPAPTPPRGGGGRGGAGSARPAPPAEIAVLRPAHHQGGASSGCRCGRANPRWRRSRARPSRLADWRAARPRRSGHGPPARGVRRHSPHEGLGLPPPCLGSASIQAIIACRRSSSIGSGQGGEPPAAPAGEAGERGSPSSLRRAERQGDLRPHAVAGDEKGPGGPSALMRAATWSAMAATSAPGWSASSPKPGRSMATQRRWGPRRSARGRQVRALPPRKCRQKRTGWSIMRRDRAVLRCVNGACPRRLAAPGMICRVIDGRRAGGSPLVGLDAAMGAGKDRLDSRALRPIRRLYMISSSRTSRRAAGFAARTANLIYVKFFHEQREPPPHPGKRRGAAQAGARSRRSAGSVAHLRCRPDPLGSRLSRQRETPRGRAVRAAFAGETPRPARAGRGIEKA